MRCNNCNQEINDTDKYCGNCGTEIEKDVLSFDSEDKLKAKVFSDSMKDVFPKINPLAINYKKEKTNEDTWNYTCRHNHFCNYYWNL